MTHDITITLDLSPYWGAMDFNISADELISSGNLVINWGDNTSETASPHEDIEHTYQSGNTYTITIDGVSDIGDYFLSQNSDVTEVTLSSNITTIGNGFCIGTHITEMIIPNSITSIGDSFCDGTDITEIVIPENVTSIGGWFCAGSALNAIHIPSNVTTIGGCFCYMCSNLRAVSFSTGLTEVGDDFIGKTLVSRLEFPEGLSISGGFSDAPNINTIIYPSSIDDIGMLAFDNANFDPQKIVFKSRTPPYINYSWENFNGTIYVPEGCINNYIEYATESGALLEDPSYYKENLTLPRALDKFGTLMRTNLKRKGIETQRNDGLTTLINKVNDIEMKEPPSGFFGDIGMFNVDNWTSPPTITNDKIILNESSTFICHDTDFPSTFTAMFTITFYDSDSYLNAPFLIGPQSISINGLGRFEFPLILKRNNGGGFEIESPITYDAWPSITELDYFEFISEGSNIVLSKFFYTDTYLSGYTIDNDFDSYDLWTYSIIWEDNDDIAALRPSSHSILLLKNDSISEYYNVSKSSELNSITPSGGAYDVYWGCWSHILHNDNNEYAWRANDEYLNDLTNYIKIIGNGQNRIDRYVLGEGEVWNDFSNANTTINKNMPFYWKIGFDYEADGIILNEDAYVQIGLDNSNHIQIGKNSNGNFLDLPNQGRFGIIDNSPIVHFELEFLGYTIDYNSTPLRVISSYKITANNYTHTYDSYNTYNSNSSNDSVDKILPYNLYKVVQSGSAKIKNLYYVDNSIAVWDKCKKNKTALYGSSVALQGNSSNTLTFNNDEYLLSGTGNYFSGREITQLYGVENARLRAKIKLNTTSSGAFNQFFIIYTDESTTYGTRIKNDKKFQHFDLSTEETIYTHSSYYSDNWFYLEAEADDGTWTVTLYDNALNILATDTQTLSGALRNPKWYIGLQTEKGENYSVHIKEILVQKI